MKKPRISSIDQMAMVNKEFFVEGIPSELSLFDLPPTQTGVENIKMENVLPTSTISENSPILFDISGQNSMKYLDLMRSQMYVKMRVKHEDGTCEFVLAIHVFTNRRQYTRESYVIHLWLLPVQSLHTNFIEIWIGCQKIATDHTDMSSFRIQFDLLLEEGRLRKF
jgi:hypothetical protein